MIIAKLDLSEMPKTCAYCRFVLHTTRSVYCDLVRDRVGVILKEREGDITKRPEWCPLEEVNPCGTCEIAKYNNLEDDDTPCQNCGEDTE